MAGDGFFDRDLEVSFERLKQDLSARGKSRYLYQFKNSPVLNDIVDKMSVYFDSDESKDIVIGLQDCYDNAIKVLEGRTIFGASKDSELHPDINNVNLDVLGYIVGQTRSAASLESLPWFTPDSDTLIVDEIPVWCQNASRSAQGNLVDSSYKNLILAKIFKNQCTAGSTVDNEYAGRYIAQGIVSFAKIGLQHYRLVLSEDVSYDDAILITTKVIGTYVSNYYLLPIPATVLIDETTVFLAPMEGEESRIFTPDQELGRPDYAKWAISIDMIGG